jgi:activator of HSP90 ATPase
VNSLGNLQLLRSDENIEKGAIPFRSWITGRRVDFHGQHMIPERLELCDILWLPEFVREREKLIRKRILELIGRSPS